MNRRLQVGLGLFAILVVVIAGNLLVTLSDKTKPEHQTPSLDAASVSTKHFLDRYVGADGSALTAADSNVNVAQAQADALLIAVAADDRVRFDLIWARTQQMLGPNGLLGSTDADLDAARAVAVAATRFGDAKYTTTATSMAQAITAHDLTNLNNEWVLVSGTAIDGPIYTSISYHSPRTEQLLGQLTDAGKWKQVSRTEQGFVADLIGKPNTKVSLPSDWAIVKTDGQLTPSGSPDNSTPVGYSAMAARTLSRLAESCDVTDRTQAARIWTVLNHSRDSQQSISMALNGDVKGSKATAAGAVAAAAGALGAQDTESMLRLLNYADQIETGNSTFYGAAQAALGRVMLTTPWLGTCQ